MPAVYDDEKLKSNSGQHDDLGVHPERREAEADSLQRQYDSSPDIEAQENDASASGSPQSTRADKQELSSLGGLYRDEGSQQDANGEGGGPRKFMAKHRKKLIGGGVAGGGVAGILISLFLMLPLQVQHMAENIQKHFSSAVDEASEDMTNRLLRSYIVNKVMPGMMDGKCTSTRVKKSCAKVSPGDSLPAIMFNAWKDARLEHKLATKHGIEIRLEGQGSNRFRIITPSLNESLGSFDPNNTAEMDGKLFAVMNKADARRELKRAMEGETFWKKTMFRFKYGSLIDRKYGIARCMIACDNERRSKTEDAWADKKLVWKGFWVDRVVAPRDELNAIALRCALGGFTCTDTPGEADERGEKVSQFEQDTRAKMAEARARHSEADMDSITARAEEYRDKGYSTVALEKLVKNELIAKGITKGIPFIGWLDLAIHLNKGAENIGPAAVKMNYVINSQAMVTTWMMFRSHADEIKTDKTNLTLMGGVAEGLSDNAGTDQNGKGAASTPLYGEIMGAKKPVTASLFTGFMTGKAYAAAEYPCNDGSKISTEQLVCPEIALNNTGAVVGGLSLYSSMVTYSNKMNPVLGIPGFMDAWIAASDGISGFIGDLLSPITDKVVSIVKGLPGAGKIIEMGEAVSKSFANWFKSVLFDDPVGESPSGGRTYDMAAVGANVAYNDFCHYKLGCRAVNAAAMESIRTAREKEEEAEFMAQPMYARMFDTSSDRSMVSQMALAFPTGSLTSLSHSFFGNLLNPAALMSSVGMREHTPASAQGDSLKDLAGYYSIGGGDKLTPKADKMGVTQYVYPSNSPVFKEDPEKAWEKYDCENPDQLKNWGNASKPNATTGMEEHEVENPCALLESVMMSNCSIYTDECLTDEELGVSAADTGAGTSLRIGSFNLRGAAHTGNGPCPNGWECRAKLSEQVIESNDIDVIGFQEFEPPQRAYMKKNLEGYDLSTHGKDSDSIMWNTSKFELGSEPNTGTWQTVYFGGAIQEPWVKLRAKDGGQEFYVMSIHDPINRGAGDSQTRYENAVKHMAEIKRLQTKAPVILVGDFNSGFAKDKGAGAASYDKLAYCILTKNSPLNKPDDIAMNNAYDLSINRKSKCPQSSKPKDFIDHIYLTPELEVESFKVIEGGYRSNGSDHPTIFADVIIPGSGDGTTVSVNGFTFPLKTDRQTILKGAGGAVWCWQAKTNCHHDYNAADIHAPTGTVVVAATGGRVVSAKDNDGSSVGSRVTIKADDGKLFYYAHMGDGTIEVHNNQRVKPGTVLGKVGTSADAVGTDPHLHIDILPKSYQSRPSCSGSGCSGYPFYDIQSTLFEVFKAMK